MSAEPALVVRASSWPELFDCSLRWYAKNVLGIRNPASSAAHLGTAIHAGTAAFDRARLEGKPVKVDDAVGVAVSTLHHPEEDVQWDEDMSAREAEPIAIRLTAGYCTDIAPKVTHSAVELRCEALDVVTESGVVRITGTTDRVRVHPDGRKGIRDLKSGSRAVGADGRAVTKGHHIQTGVYRVMSEHAAGEALTAPSEIVGLQTTKNGRIGIGEIADDRTPLIGNDEAPGLVQIAAQMASSGLFPPNPKSNLCSAKYCPYFDKCSYHD